MKELFSIGLNDGGFYVFPCTKPPQHNTNHGDEICLQEAMDLRDALNDSVATYISWLAEDTPDELLREIAKSWSWRSILNIIEDLIWHAYLRMPGATPQGMFYKNWMALCQLLANWVE